jgi:hypothetical protein
MAEAAENGTQTIEELERNLHEYRTQLKQVGRKPTTIDLGL